MKEAKLFFLFIFLSTFSLSQDLEKERVRWNNSLTKDTTYKFSKLPNALLVEAIKNKKPGTALDIGMGQGRNSLYLASKGWKVTGIDIADEAITAAKQQAEKQKLMINAVLSSHQDFDFGTEQWDLVAYIYEGCLDIDIVAKIKKSLKHKGIIVFEFFHREAGVKLGRPTFGCETNTIKQLFTAAGDFKITRYEEAEGVADFGLEKYKLVKLVAVKK
ncbi:MAG: class I SAM-dependent methyltransferase [Cyclobacteriaceae bacterium]